MIVTSAPIGKWCQQRFYGSVAREHNQSFLLALFRSFSFDRKTAHLWRAVALIFSAPSRNLIDAVSYNIYRRLSRASYKSAPISAMPFLAITGYSRMILLFNKKITSFKKCMQFGTLIHSPMIIELQFMINGQTLCNVMCACTNCKYN